MKKHKQITRILWQQFEKPLWQRFEWSITDQLKDEVNRQFTYKLPYILRANVYNEIKNNSNEEA